MTQEQLRSQTEAECLKLWNSGPSYRMQPKLKCLEIPCKTCGITFTSSFRNGPESGPLYCSQECRKEAAREAQRRFKLKRGK